MYCFVLGNKDELESPIIFLLYFSSESVGSRVGGVFDGYIMV